MSTELETNLRTILREKTQKILPQNIKTGVTILGVTGTYDGGSGIDINLFVQETEPSTYNGIWIKSNTFTYDSIVENDGTTLVANSINIVKGDSHETKFFNVENDLYYRFNRIVLTDQNNNKISNVRVFYGNGNSWVNLPQYVELEYIEGTGTQYINSGFKPNQNTRIEMKVGDPTSGAYFFGAWNTAYNRGAYAFGNDNSSLYAGYDNQGGGFGTIISGDTTIDMNKKDIYINGALSKSFNVDTFQVNYDLYLFCQNRAGTPTWNSVSTPHSFKLYYCKIYDNDILTRDFIPVKDLNDVVCLYDKVSDTFFYNQGTGDFIGGPEI